MTTRTTRTMLGWAALAAGLALSAGLAGCNGKTLADNKDKVDVETYKNLAHQRCAVIVWADWNTRTQYNQIQLDLARQVQQRLVAAPKPDEDSRKDKRKDEKAQPAITFVDPASVIRYQREHPELEGKTASEVAPLLGVTRLLYVEIAQFSAQSEHSILLLKGTAQATLRVVEVSNGHGTIAFEDTGLVASFPPNAPEGVVPGDKYSLRSVYEGTVTMLADEIAARFENVE